MATVLMMFKDEIRSGGTYLKKIINLSSFNGGIYKKISWSLLWTTDGKVAERLRISK